MDRFALSLIFEYFSKIRRENSNFIKIWQEQRVLYIIMNINFLAYLKQFFLERKIFQAILLIKSKQNYIFNNFFF